MSDFRRTDGLDASGTTDAYGSGNRDPVQRDDEVFANRAGADTTDTTRSGGYGDRTSGGLGYDDTIGRSGRTGGGDYAGDQERSGGTSGGLGHNDTYGDERTTGGNDTGYDHNYGMGTGRTYDQEQGGVIPTEPGRLDDRDTTADRARAQTAYDADQSGTVQEEGLPGNRRGDYSENSSGDSSGQKDSTMGKIMEKAGGLLKNEGLQQRGAEKRSDAGGY